MRPELSLPMIKSATNGNHHAIKKTAAGLALIVAGTLSMIPA